MKQSGNVVFVDFALTSEQRRFKDNAIEISLSAAILEFLRNVSVIPTLYC